jgi:hypothetical protein
MRKNKKSSGSIILSRVAMIGENRIPDEVRERLVPTNEALDISLTA